MHEAPAFDEWLATRLAAHGVVGGHIEDDDLHAGIERYQQVNGLPVTGLACEQTRIFLRQQKSRDPASPLIIFHAVPSVDGSRYVPSSEGGRA